MGSKNQSADSANTTAVASVEDLQQELTNSMKALLADANDKAAELELKLEASENDTRIQAEARISESEERHALREENSKLRTINDDLTAKIEYLSDELDKRKNPGEVLNEARTKEKAVLPSNTFEVYGVTKKFISPVFTYKGNRLVAAEAMNNQELLKELVDAKCGSIVDVNKII